MKAFIDLLIKRVRMKAERLNERRLGREYKYAASTGNDHASSHNLNKLRSLSPFQTTTMNSLPSDPPTREYIDWRLTACRLALDRRSHLRDDLKTNPAGRKTA